MHDVEGQICACLDAGDTDAALRVAVVEIGPEVLSFLAAVHSSQEEAAEVFAEACADLVRTIHQFERRCAFRTWFYALARNASHRYFADGYRRRRRCLDDAGELATSVRTTTAEFLKTTWKDQLRALRDTLAPADRALLVLRVDRGMEWSDIARVLGEEGDAARASARLRKRFERVKDRLRRAATVAGWLDAG